jgi:hypothetical protein
MDSEGEVACWPNSYIRKAWHELILKIRSCGNSGFVNHIQARTRKENYKDNDDDERYKTACCCLIFGFSFVSEKLGCWKEI